MRLQLALRNLAIDLRPIRQAYQKAERQVLMRAAGRGRVMARRRMRKRSRSSRPGEGPTERKGQLKRFLVYAYEPAKHVAVFGPRKLSGARGDTPEALERGKTTMRRVGRGRNRRRQAVRYEKRPAMVPALQELMPAMPAMWKNAIK